MRVEMNERGLAALDAEIQRYVERAADQVADRARFWCPEKTGLLLSTIVREPGTSKHTELVAVGGGDAYYWAYMEFGTRPHIIRSHGPWPLRNRETGQVFGQVVRHPGTPEYAYMREALYEEVSL